MNSYGDDEPAPGAGKGVGSPETITGSAAAERAMRKLRAGGHTISAARRAFG